MRESFQQHIQQYESLLNALGRSGSEKVYAHLLKGEPLPIKLFSELLLVDVDEAKKILATYGEADDQGRVAGFLGLSLITGQHKLMVKGKALYTCCAMDAVMLPQILLFEAVIESEDPVNGQAIQLSVNEDFLDWTDPVPLYISWEEKAGSDYSRQNFCDHSHFFGSQETAEEWLAKNKDTAISNVEEFFTFSRGGRGCC